MGIQFGQLQIPVCNSFKAKIVRDQLCYEVDPNKYKHNINLQGEISLSLFIDFNEDRETGEIQSYNPFITINTIGGFTIKTSQSLKSHEKQLFYLQKLRKMHFGSSLID